MSSGRGTGFWVCSNVYCVSVLKLSLTLLYFTLRYFTLLSLSLRLVTHQHHHPSHDYIEIDKDRPTGPRILTAYLYLNDVLEGGVTNFPQPKEGGLTVMPKKDGCCYGPPY